MQGKTALVFGASGLVGSKLLPLLLESPDYDKIKIVLRKPNPQLSHPKLQILIADLQTLDHISTELGADHLYIAIGTTRKKTPDLKEYYAIDHDYPIKAAELAKLNGATSVALVSAVGANATSGIFYIKTKGETERDLIALDYEHTHIFRPSMIMGERGEKLPLEKFFMGLFAMINPLFAGGMSKYRGIEAVDIARAMLQANTSEEGKVNICEWKEMIKLKEK